MLVAADNIFECDDSLRALRPGRNLAKAWWFFKWSRRGASQHAAAEYQMVLGDASHRIWQATFAAAKTTLRIAN
jgi:hypothetical protein